MLNLSEASCSLHVFHTDRCVVVSGDFEGLHDAEEIMDFARKVGATSKRGDSVDFVLDFRNSSYTYFGITTYSQTRIHETIQNELAALAI